jgi:hypothetical protein
MVFAFIPQEYQGNIPYNTNFPPQSNTEGGGPPSAFDELVEETFNDFVHLKYDQGDDDGFVLIQGGGGPPEDDDEDYLITLGRDSTEYLLVAARNSVDFELVL